MLKRSAGSNQTCNPGFHPFVPEEIKDELALFSYCTNSASPSLGMQF
jgi:hypothetical protein